MHFTTGRHQSFEQLMKQVPHFDQQPREIKGQQCLACTGYNAFTGKCRYCVCIDDQPLPKNRK